MSLLILLIIEIIFFYQQYNWVYFFTSSYILPMYSPIKPSPIRFKPEKKVINKIVEDSQGVIVGSINFINK